MNRAAKRRPTTTPPTRAETPTVQLEIAAMWLHEAAMRLTELKHIGHDCEAMARRV